MSEDDRSVSLEDSTPQDEPALPGPDPGGGAPPEEEPEHLEAVEVKGKRMVDVSVVAAERRRAREVTERVIREKEVAPLKEIATQYEQLKAYVSQITPYVDHLRAHPELLQPPTPTSAEAAVSEEEAAEEARDLELYRADGQLDLSRAKRIVARRRQETTAAARAAAHAAVGPVQKQTAEELSRRNLERIALQQDPQGQPLLQTSVDPKVLAQLWAQLPAELTAHPEVGDLLVDVAMGRTQRVRGSGVPRPVRGPIISESAGGSRPNWEMDPLTKAIARAAGVTEKTFEERAKTFQPGVPNVIGD